MYFVVDRLGEDEKSRIEAKIQEEIERSLGAAVHSVNFDWTHLREDEATISITIEIQRAADPRTWRDGFAGLTSRIKNAMGERLESVFPVLMARAA